MRIGLLKWLYSFLSSAVDVSELSAPRPGRFTRGKESRCP